MMKIVELSFWLVVLIFVMVFGLICHILIAVFGIIPFTKKTHDDEGVKLLPSHEENDLNKKDSLTTSW